MLFWLAIILSSQLVLVGLLGWFLCRKNETAIFTAISRVTRESPARDQAVAGDALSTAGKAMSMHSDELEAFEQLLMRQSMVGEHPGLLKERLGQIRRANQSVEEVIENTVEQLLASCGDLLGDEQSTLEAYRAKTSQFDGKLEGIDRESLLARIATNLLVIVRDLHQENQATRKEVADGREKIIELSLRAENAEQDARLDALTKLPNRRTFDETLAKFDKALSDNGQEFSMILLDIDHFKSVNDQYGHPTGDAVLGLLGRILRDSGHGSATACRLGGEEFGVLLLGSNEESAKRTANRYRRKIEAAVLHFNNREVSVTVSCGVAEAIRGEAKGGLFERADVALFSAKQLGRNQTCTDSEAAVSA
jgi:diguanylate cyclase